MTDRTAVVWTRSGGVPGRLGLLVVTDREVRFTYDNAAPGMPGLSVVHDTTRLAGRSIVMPRSERNPLPPMLQALVPPRDPRNLQRRILDMRLGEAPMSAVEREWRMLLLAGRDGIGHLDIFGSDELALSWYGNRKDLPPVKIGGGVWHLALGLISEVAPPPVGIDELLRAVGNSPSPGGVMPKLLVRVSGIERRPVDALVKMDDWRHYRGALDLEAMSLGLHRDLGLDVPRFWLRQGGDGVKVLVIERFDRTADGTPIPVESLFSVLHAATAGRLEERWSDPNVAAAGGVVPTFEIVGEALRDPRVGITTDPKGDGEDLYFRVVLALLTGNGDTHLENLAVRGGRGHARLSPVFDPTPMRGYPEHRMVSAVSFGGMSGMSGGEMPVDLGNGVLELAKAFGLSARSGMKVIERALAGTADFRERVLSCGAPEDVTAALLGRVAGVRTRIERAVNEMTPKVAMPARSPGGDLSLG